MSTTVDRLDRLQPEGPDRSNEVMARPASPASKGRRCRPATPPRPEQGRRYAGVRGRNAPDVRGALLACRPSRDRSRRSGCSSPRRLSCDHVLSGMVAGSRRDTRELYSITVRDNEIEVELLWPGNPEVERLPETRVSDRDRPLSQLGRRPEGSRVAVVASETAKAPV